MPRVTARKTTPARTTAPLARTLRRILGADVPVDASAWALELLGRTPGRAPLVAATTLDGTPFALTLLPDQPFLTDTVLMTVRRHGHEPAAVWHPVLNVERGPRGVLAGISSAEGAHGGARRESLILLKLEEPLLPGAKAALEQALAEAQAAFRDFGAMQDRLLAARDHLRTQPVVDPEELAFLDWITEGHMVLLGSRHYDYRGTASRTVQVTHGSGLGILNDESRSRAVKAVALESLGHLADYLTEASGRGGSVVISKTPERSSIHRDAAMDFVSILERDAKGNVTGEQRFLGLWTSRAYTRHVMDIPLVRAKIAAVLKASTYPAGSLKARALVNILETWPRDELFLTSAADLRAMAEAVVELRERPDVALLVRRSPREGAVAVQVFIPQSRYHSRLRGMIMTRLVQTFEGIVQDYRLEMGEGHGEGLLARLLVRLQVDDAAAGDAAALEKDLRQMVRGWEDDVRALDAGLWHRYGQLAGAGYREAVPPARALADFSALAAGRVVEIVPQEGRVELRLFSQDRPGYPLFQLVPLLGSAGLALTDEHEYLLGVARVQVLTATPLRPVEQGDVAEMERLVAGNLAGGEFDDLNRLVLLGGLGVRQIGWLRLLAAYAQQVDRGFEPTRTRTLLLDNPALATDLATLFALRTDPSLSAKQRNGTLRTLMASLEDRVTALPTSAQEKLARTLLDCVLAVVRTNAFQPGVIGVDPHGDVPLAIKLDPARVGSLPHPRPWRETFVYHPSVEGVHLRGGPVARGGLRHSDRATDYRTEVLGLMVAQMRKNTIIVPVGAKGGFYVKDPLPADRAAAGKVVEANYRRYIRALLSLSDTYDAKGQVLPPRGVLRHDGDDPYLVVAADKGTSTFSDIANGEALAADFWDRKDKGRGFWLGDAFATGGSIGYDHKGMGITSRGAWISVQHHLRTLGIRPSADRPLTVVGIGDMAGDVFGNGLLREPHTQLIGAFNHAHVFLDPTPDPKASFAERQRCFDARLGWDGYDKTKISSGGGVWPRTAKLIPLTAKMQALLGLKKAQAAPDEVISALLRAPVDLIWNGGIGTFIKAMEEPHSAAADRANDGIRVDATQVRARIIGEGGNLGITPRGRVQLGLPASGTTKRPAVCLNTDALDNSAGVDTSDHEVNLKILLQQAMANGLLDEAGRRKLLKAMTGDVADAVLTDNRLQNMAITLEERATPDDHRDLMAWQDELLRRGVVDMTVDCLPTHAQFEQRAQLFKDGPRYARPELCALLAGTKATVRQQLLQVEAMDILACDAVQPLLAAYFPARLRTDFAKLIPRHRLARELVATALSNELVNRLGMLFGPRLGGDFGAAPLDAIRAATAACALLDARSLWQGVDEASPRIPLETEVAAHMRIRQVAYGLAAWVLRHGQPVQLTHWLEELVQPVCAAATHVPKLLSPTARADAATFVQTWEKQGLPAPLAKRFGGLSPLVVVPDAVLLAKRLKKPVADVLQVQLGVGELLKIPGLIRRIRTISAPDIWTRQALQAMVQELFACQRQVSAALLQHKGAPTVLLNSWQTAEADALARYHALVDDLLRQPKLTVAMLSVLVGRLRELE